MIRIENKPKSIVAIATECANTYRDCFAWYSTESWVKHFASRRFETICILNKEEHNIDISSREKLFVKTFTESMMLIIEDKKKEHIQKEKEAKKKSKNKKKVAEESGEEC